MAPRKFWRSTGSARAASAWGWKRRGEYLAWSDMGLGLFGMSQIANSGAVMSYFVTLGAAVGEQEARQVGGRQDPAPDRPGIP